MSNPASHEQDEQPLDPAAARIQQRLQGLMLIAGLTLGLGILAVFFAIIYRINASGDKDVVPAAPIAAVPPASIAPPGEAAPAIPAVPAAPAAAPLLGEKKAAAIKEARAVVPADARLMASTVAGDRIVLTYDHFAGTLVLIFDPETLELVGRLDIEPTP
jgi:hypothetical protein